MTETVAGRASYQTLPRKELSSGSKGYGVSEATNTEGTTRRSALAGSLLSTLQANAGMEKTPK